MHLELVELLRCPVAHASSVLVAAANTISNRYVTEGVLGCPECFAEYEVRGGVTNFAKRQSAGIADAALPEPMRLAAQLGLTSGRSVFALVGHDVATMVAMRDIVAARILLLNPAALDATAFPTEMLRDAALVAPTGVATFGSVLPLVTGKFDGIAVHSAPAPSELLNQCATALRAGGRLVAHAQATMPSGMREMVRDEHVWVAERESLASAPVGITRR